MDALSGGFVMARKAGAMRHPDLTRRIPSLSIITKPAKDGF